MTGLKAPTNQLTVSIGSRTNTSLRFADDIDCLAEEEVAKLVERLDKASTAYGIEISSEKTKLMRNNTSGINADINVNWQKLETVTSLEMRCYRKILHISYKDHVTNEEVRTKTQQATGPHKGLLTIVKRHKLQWYGHVSRSSGLAKTILQGTVKGGLP